MRARAVARSPRHSLTVRPTRSDSNPLLDVQGSVSTYPLASRNASAAPTPAKIHRDSHGGSQALPSRPSSRQIAVGRSATESSFTGSGRLRSSVSPTPTDGDRPPSRDRDSLLLMPASVLLAKSFKDLTPTRTSTLAASSARRTFRRPSGFCADGEASSAHGPSPHSASSGPESSKLPSIPASPNVFAGGGANWAEGAPAVSLPPSCPRPHETLLTATDPRVLTARRRPRADSFRRVGLGDRVATRETAARRSAQPAALARVSREAPAARAIRGVGRSRISST